MKILGGMLPQLPLGPGGPIPVYPPAAPPDAASAKKAGGIKPAGTEPDSKIDDAAQRRRAEAEQAATDFETMFTDLMLKSMRQTAQPEEASNAHEIYQGMLDQEYSKTMASRGDLGIRDMILQWMEQAEPSLVEAKAAMDGYKAQSAAMSVRQPK